MLSSSLQITISLWQPLHLRVWRGIADAAQAVWLALLRAPHVLAQRMHRREAWSGLSDLSAHTLKDIGAPDWVVLDAADRRDLARQRLDVFGGWRGV
jgi:hypothetical protein